MLPKPTKKQKDEIDRMLKNPRGFRDIYKDYAEDWQKERRMPIKLMDVWIYPNGETEVE